MLIVRIEPRREQVFDAEVRSDHVLLWRGRLDGSDADGWPGLLRLLADAAENAEERLSA